MPIDLVQSVENHMQAVKSVNLSAVRQLGQDLVNIFRNEGKIMICGCGGSAADAQHFAAELVVRFSKTTQRICHLPAIALNADTAVLTAAANDYGFWRAYGMQIRALGTGKDALIALSTSGHSPIIVNALQEARAWGINRYLLTGSELTHDQLTEDTDLQIIRVSSDNTARIQEVHALILHLLCEMIDEAFAV